MILYILAGLILAAAAGLSPAYAVNFGTDPRGALCGVDLSGEEPADAAPPAWSNSTPPPFRTLDHARGRVRSTKKYLSHHLTADDFAAITRDLDAPDPDEDTLPSVVEHVGRLFERATERFAAELETHAGVVEKALGVRLGRAERRGDDLAAHRLRRLAAQLGLCRKSRSFGACADVWLRARQEVNFRFPFTKSPAPALAADEPPSENLGPRPIDEVTHLDVIGDEVQKLAL